MGRLLLASLLSLMCLPALADEVEGPHVQGETFEYATGGQTYQGYLAYNASDDEPRPGVLLVHEVPRTIVQAIPLSFLFGLKSYPLEPRDGTADGLFSAIIQASRP